MGKQNAVKGKNASPATPPKRDASDATADYAALLGAKRVKDAAQKTADDLAALKDKALTTATDAVEKEFAARDKEAEKNLTDATEAYEKCKETCGLD